MPRSHPAALVVHRLAPSARPACRHRPPATWPRRSGVSPRRPSAPGRPGPRHCSHLPGPPADPGGGRRCPTGSGLAGGRASTRRPLAGRSTVPRFRYQFSPQLPGFATRRASRCQVGIPGPGLCHREPPRRTVAWRKALVRPRPSLTDRSRCSGWHRRQLRTATAAPLVLRRGSHRRVGLIATPAPAPPPAQSHRSPGPRLAGSRDTRPGRYTSSPGCRYAPWHRPR